MHGTQSSVVGAVGFPATAAAATATTATAAAAFTRWNQINVTVIYYSRLTSSATYNVNATERKTRVT